VETNPDIEHRTLRINGLDMHVELAGDGVPLLLLHGFPDSSVLWRKMVSALVAGGFRVIAPDQRGFGQTTAPAHTDAYTVAQIAADAIALLDALGIARAALMAHDWGSVIGWRLAADHPDRFTRYVALAVGHPNALVRAGLPQMLKSWYVVAFQLRGIAEAIVSAGDFWVLRRMTGNEPEIAIWRTDLSRPGRLTAGMNWYRANFIDTIKADAPRARIPVLGFIGSADVALTVTQMANSGAFCDAPFAWQMIDGAGHWLPLHAADTITPGAIAFLQATD
jgi:pimeloyl-ACP methyl ester carboxylesterase